MCLSKLGASGQPRKIFPSGQAKAFGEPEFLCGPDMLSIQGHATACVLGNNCRQSQQSLGWSLGYVSAIDSSGRTIWIADAHRGDGKRFVVRADDKLTAFVELEAAIRGPRRERIPQPAKRLTVS
jgi:hypothetical protein